MVESRTSPEACAGVRSVPRTAEGEQNANTRPTARPRRKVFIGEVDKSNQPRSSPVITYWNRGAKISRRTSDLSQRIEDGRAGHHSPEPKKMAPLLGPLVKEARWKVESGMAMR